MTEREREFLTKLADLITEYDVIIHIDDSNVHYPNICIDFNTWCEGTVGYIEVGKGITREGLLAT